MDSSPAEPSLTSVTCPDHLSRVTCPVSDQSSGPERDSDQSSVPDDVSRVTCPVSDQSSVPDDVSRVTCPADQCALIRHVGLQASFSPTSPAGDLVSVTEYPDD